MKGTATVTDISICKTQICNQNTEAVKEFGLKNLASIILIGFPNTFKTPVWNTKMGWLNKVNKKS